MKIRWNLPPGLVGDLYVVGPDNTLARLEDATTSESGEGVWPAVGPSRIRGQAGTEMLLLGVRRASDPQPKIAWDSGAAWPALPDDLVLRRTPGKTEVLPVDRAIPFDPPRPVNDPEDAIRKRLTALQDALKDYHYFEAIVLGVREPE